MKKVAAIATLILAASLIQGRAAEEAQKNWEEHCAKCHGKDGKADTKMGQKLKVRDLTDAKVQSSFTDEQAFKDIKQGMTVEGKKVMPGFAEKLTDEDIKALVSHVRTLKKK